MSEENTKSPGEFKAVLRKSAPLTSPESIQSRLVSVKKSKSPGDEGSNTSTGYIGEQPHPICMQTADDLTSMNPYHERCLATKTASIIGQGLRKDEAYTVLDPLCARDFDFLMACIDRDVRKYGFGFMEVVRDDDNYDLITGLYHLLGQRQSKRSACL